MTGQQLREQLARLADSAPTATVPDDTFRRGRRATTRARIASAVLVAGCLVLAAAIGIDVGARHKTDAPGPADGTPSGSVMGVPDELYSPPSDETVPTSSTLKTGIAAAAFLGVTQQVIVVDAADGGYHQLEPAGMLAQTSKAGVPTFALSPNGRYLAWAYADETSGGLVAPSAATGIRVADLTTGHTVLDGAWSGATTGRRPAHVLSIAWSGNSEYVGWEGVVNPQWTDSSARWAPTYVGMIDRLVGPSSGRLQVVDVPRSGLDTSVNLANDTDYSGYPTRPIAVRDDGQLVAVAGRTLESGPVQRRFELSDFRMIGAIWLSGSRIIGTENAPRGCCLRVRELPGGRVLRGDNLHGGAANITVPRVAGTLRSGGVLLQQGVLQGSVGPVKLVPASAAGQVETVIVVDEYVGELTLATDLMTPDHLTVHRPVPDWPDPNASTIHGGRNGLYAGTGAAAALLLAGVVWWRRRRLALM